MEINYQRLQESSAPSRMENRFGKQCNSHGATNEFHEVIIRSYQNFDNQDCLDLFKEGNDHWINLALRLDFPRYCWYIAVVGVLALSTAAFTWSTYIACLYIGVSIIISVLFYCNTYKNGKEYLYCSLKEDLKDIGKSYMSSEGCHMWVAEWNGKVVGMVGLLHNENHEPRVAEIKRMYVLSSLRRKGIARKLFERLLSYAKGQRYEKIVLSTTSANTGAILFYKKYGFQLIQVLPFPQGLPTDLRLYYFKLHL
ncbi:hypothetical protein ACROYT_G030739 [Oculina patagonica]